MPRKKRGKSRGKPIKGPNISDDHEEENAPNSEDSSASKIDAKKEDISDDTKGENIPDLSVDEIDQPKEKVIVQRKGRKVKSVIPTPSRTSRRLIKLKPPEDLFTGFDTPVQSIPEKKEEMGENHESKYQQENIAEDKGFDGKQESVLTTPEKKEDIGSSHESKRSNKRLRDSPSKFQQEKVVEDKGFDAKQETVLNTPEKKEDIGRIYEAKVCIKKLRDSPSISRQENIVENMECYAEGEVDIDLSKHIVSKVDKLSDDKVNVPTSIEPAKENDDSLSISIETLKVKSSQQKQKPFRKVETCKSELVVDEVGEQTSLDLGQLDSKMDISESCIPSNDHEDEKDLKMDAEELIVKDESSGQKSDSSKSLNSTKDAANSCISSTTHEDEKKLNDASFPASKLASSNTNNSSILKGTLESTAIHESPNKTSHSELVDTVETPSSPLKEESKFYTKDLTRPEKVELPVTKDEIKTGGESVKIFDTSQTQDLLVSEDDLIYDEFHLETSKSDSFENSSEATTNKLNDANMEKKKEFEIQNVSEYIVLDSIEEEMEMNSISSHSKEKNASSDKAELLDKPISDNKLDSSEKVTSDAIRTVSLSRTTSRSTNKAPQKLDLKVKSVTINKSLNKEARSVDQKKHENYDTAANIIPGQSYIVCVDSTSKEVSYFDKMINFDCVVCQFSNNRHFCTISEHGNSKEHVLKIMELECPKLYQLHKDDKTITDVTLKNLVTSHEEKQKKQSLVIASKDEFPSKKNLVKKRMNALIQNNWLRGLCTTSEEARKKEEKFNEEEARLYIDIQVIEIARRQKTRSFSRIIIIMDENDVDMSATTLGEYVKVLRRANLTFDNVLETLKEDEWFGKGTLHVFLGGVYSLIGSKPHMSCEKAGCPNPVEINFIEKNLPPTFLISKALSLQESILDATDSDLALFCDIFPVNIDTKNCMTLGKRPCLNTHTIDLDRSIPDHITNLYLECIREYNKFIESHSRSLGFDFWDLTKSTFSMKTDDLKCVSEFLNEDGVSVREMKCLRRESMIVYHATNLVKKRKEMGEDLAIDGNKRLLEVKEKENEETEEIEQKMEVEENRENKEIIGIKENERIESKEVEEKENEKIKENEIEVIKEIKEEDIPKATKPRFFDKIVILFEGVFEEALQKFLALPKISAVPFLNMDIEMVKSSIKSQSVDMPSKTLWVLLVGCGLVTDVKQCSSCTSTCSSSLFSATPKISNSTTQDVCRIVDNTFSSIKSLRDHLKTIINPESEFIIIPPIPLAIYVETEFDHKSLHSMQATNFSFITADEIHINHLKQLLNEFGKEAIRMLTDMLKKMNLPSDPFTDYKKSLSNDHVQIVRNPENTSKMPFALWKMALSKMFYLLLNEKKDIKFESVVKADKKSISVPEAILISDDDSQINDAEKKEKNLEVKNESTIPIPKEKFDNIVIINVGRLRNQNPINITSNNILCWKLELPIKDDFLDRISYLMESNSKTLFVLIGDIALAGTQKISSLCEERKCKNPIYCTLFDGFHSAVDEGINMLKDIKEKFKSRFLGVNCRVIIGPICPRFVIRSSLNHSENSLIHGNEHKADSHRSNPCFIEAEENRIDEAISVFKSKWNKELNLDMNSLNPEAKGLLTKYLRKNIPLIEWKTTALSSLDVFSMVQVHARSLWRSFIDSVVISKKSDDDETINNDMSDRTTPQQENSYIPNQNSYPPMHDPSLNFPPPDVAPPIVPPPDQMRMGMPFEPPMHHMSYMPGPMNSHPPPSQFMNNSSNYPMNFDPHPYQQQFDNSGNVNYATGYGQSQFNNYQQPQQFQYSEQSRNDPQQFQYSKPSQENPQQFQYSYPSQKNPQQFQYSKPSQKNPQPFQYSKPSQKNPQQFQYSYPSQKNPQQSKPSQKNIQQYQYSKPSQKNPQPFEYSKQSQKIFQQLQYSEQSQKKLQPFQCSKRSENNILPTTAVQATYEAPPNIEVKKPAKEVTHVAPKPRKKNLINLTPILLPKNPLRKAPSLWPELPSTNVSATSTNTSTATTDKVFISDPYSPALASISKFSGSTVHKVKGKATIDKVSIKDPFSSVLASRISKFSGSTVHKVKEKDSTIGTSILELLRSKDSKSVELTPSHSSKRAKSPTFVRNVKKGHKKSRSRSPRISSRSQRSPSLSRKRPHSRSSSVSKRRRSRSTSRKRRLHSHSSRRSRSRSKGLRRPRSSSRDRRSVSRTRQRSRSRTRQRSRSRPKSPSGKLRMTEFFDSKQPRLQSANITSRQPPITSNKIEKEGPSFSSSLGEMFGDQHHKFLEAEKELRNTLEEDYKVFKTFPELHPNYENYYEEFSNMYIGKFGSFKSKDHKEQHFKEFWTAKFPKIKFEECLKRRSDLVSEYKEKARTNVLQGVQGGSSKSVSEKSSTENFSVEGTLTILENLSDKMGVVGPALTAIIRSARQFGVNTPKGLSVFTDDENLIIINMTVKRLKSSLETASSDIAPTLYTAVDWIHKLLEYAKNPPNKPNLENLNLEAIAKACAGRDSGFILNMIKTAIAYEGVSDVPKEEINNIFLKICSIHFNMQMGIK